MRSRGYVPLNAVDKAENSSLKWWIDLLLFALVIAVALGITQAVFLYNSQSLQDQQISGLTFNVTQLDAQDQILLMNISEVNMTNMNKIQTLREETNNNFTIVRMDIDLIEDILNVSGTGAASFSELVMNNFTMVNNEIILLQAKDMTLMGNVTDLYNNLTSLESNVNMISNNLTSQIHMRMKTINNVSGSMPDGEFFLNPLAGISISASASPNTLDVGNTGVLTIQGQAPSMGDIHLVPHCGLNISAGPMGHEVTIDACQLATSITNIDINVMNQGMQIAQLNATDMDLQMQIDALMMAGDTIANMTGMDIEGVNMTLNQLITQVMILQMQVETLENTLSQANNTYVPRGSIIPYGGLTAPLGFLLCDGTLVQTSVYPDLFALIGNDFCIAPCPMGFFALPDMRGRVPAAQDGATFTVRGTRVGNEMETLSLTHIPTHSHTISSSGTHQHTVMLSQGDYFTSGGGSAIQGCANGMSQIPTVNVIGTVVPTFTSFTPPVSFECPNSGSGFGWRFRPERGSGNPFGANGAESGGDHNHGGATGSAGSGSAHPNIQPTLTVGSYIIKW